MPIDGQPARVFGVDSTVLIPVVKATYALSIPQRGDRPARIVPVRGDSLDWSHGVVANQEIISGGVLDLEANYALLRTAQGQLIKVTLPSGKREILERTFGDWNGAYFPVVRRVEVKYKNPAKGRLFSTGSINEDRVAKANKELSEKGRTLVDVMVKILDEGKNITFESTFTWFIAKDKK